jgi:hypothetical protein
LAIQVVCGSNDNKIPHMNKSKMLQDNGTLPVTIEVTSVALAYLKMSASDDDEIVVPG